MTVVKYPNKREVLELLKERTENVVVKTQDGFTQVDGAKVVGDVINFLPNDARYPILSKKPEEVEFYFIDSELTVLDVRYVLAKEDRLHASKTEPRRREGDRNDGAFKCLRRWLEKPSERAAIEATFKNLMDTELREFVHACILNKRKVEENGYS